MVERRRTPTQDPSTYPQARLVAIRRQGLYSDTTSRRPDDVVIASQSAVLNARSKHGALPGRALSKASDTPEQDTQGSGQHPILFDKTGGECGCRASLLPWAQ